MSHSLPANRTIGPRISGLLFAGGLLLAGAVLGLVVAELLLSPSAGERRDLAFYFAISGVATFAAGRIATTLLDRASALSLRLRAVIIAAVGTVVALANVLIVADLMFISTGHDLKLLVALIAFSGIAALGFAWWSTASTVARVDAISTAVRTLARGNYAASLETGAHDEIGDLATDVQLLATRLREAETQRADIDRERRHLTAAISHDLRTPLASVRAMVEALDDSVVDEPAEVRRYHAAIRRETERLNRMIDDLLDLAQMDAGVLGLSLQQVAIEEIAAEVVDGIRIQAERAGVTLTLESASGVPALAIDGARIERSIANLIRNAIEHTPPGGSIRTTVEATREEVVISVADSGGGIDQHELPRIWERFYRGDESRRRQTNPGAPEGTGLGLSIVRGFVEAHGGSVGVETKPGSGATFTIRLPRTSAL